ncbi:MAG: hypothetical protein RBU30_26715 [Polyangia bacterium]|jgi:hypothetical protein|nr:hypothetical protein [Polyangia bacterium]
MAACTFDWPASVPRRDSGASDATSGDATPPTDAQAPTDASACDAGGLECEVCGLNCGENQDCDAGHCVCSPGYLDCNGEQAQDGCEWEIHYRSQDFSWFSTLDSVGAVEVPDFGHQAAVVVGNVSFVPALVGAGAQIGASTGEDRIEIPCCVDPFFPLIQPTSGVIQFWYRPDYDSTDDYRYAHFLSATGVSQDNFEFSRNDYDLYFKIESQAEAPGFSISARVLGTAPAEYSWSAGEWVLLSVAWCQVGCSPAYLEIRMNGQVLKRTENQPKAWSITDDILVGSFGAGRKLNGTIDELMFFHTDAPELFGGPFCPAD